MDREPDFVRVSARLLAAFVEINEDCVGGRLRIPTFAIERLPADRLGQWCRIRRQIAVSVSHLLTEPWSAVIETLRHEMAHQFADEILGVTDETPHGPAFRRACEVLRADPEARRLHDPVGPTDDPGQAATRRISKLLALADGSASPHEAASALRKARELMSGAGSRPGGSAVVHHTLELGRVRKRHEAWEYALANLLTDGFGVSIVWVPSYAVAEDRDGTAMLAHGTRSQLQTAEHAHAFLTAVLPRAWAEHRRKERIRSDRDRARFAHGFLLGVRDRMFGSKSAAIGSDLGSSSSASPTTALVPFGIDVELEQFVRFKHPRIRTVSVGGGGSAAGGFADGRKAGREISLYRPVGHDSGQGTRLLADR